MTRRLAIAVVALAALLPVAAAEAQIDRGPYIQIATPDSMVVAWRTAAAADSRVCYGARADALTSMAMGTAGVRQHEVRITGLMPATRYYYRAGAVSCPPAAACRGADECRSWGAASGRSSGANRSACNGWSSR